MIPVGIGFVNFIESDSAQKAGCDCLGMIGLVTGKRNNPMAIAAIALLPGNSNHHAAPKSHLSQDSSKIEIQIVPAKYTSWYTDNPNSSATSLRNAKPLSQAAKPRLARPFAL